MPVGHAYKFFDFYISYTVLNIPCLFCTCQFVLLNPSTFSPILPHPLPADNPPNDLHIYDAVPVLVVCLVCLLDSIVDSCEFVVNVHRFNLLFLVQFPFTFQIIMAW